MLHIVIEGREVEYKSPALDNLISQRDNAKGLYESDDTQVSEKIKLMEMIGLLDIQISEEEYRIRLMYGDE